MLLTSVGVPGEVPASTETSESNARSLESAAFSTLYI